jgi:RNA polymerase sigma-70 factor (ECF subfamily)
MAEAAQRQRAAEIGAEAIQRVELLRLRFEENLPIRAIAELWGTDAARLHHAYAKARQEFRAALMAVVAFHQPGSRADLEREVTELLRAIS